MRKLFFDFAIPYLPVLLGESQRLPLAGKAMASGSLVGFAEILKRGTELAVGVLFHRLGEESGGARIGRWRGEESCGIAGFTEAGGSSKKKDKKAQCGLPERLRHKNSGGDEANVAQNSVGGVKSVNAC